MKTERHYVTAVCLGLNEPEEHIVVLSLTGPRGGTKAIEAMTIEAATQLRDDLDAIITTVGGLPAPTWEIQE